MPQLNNMHEVSFPLSPRHSQNFGQYHGGYGACTSTLAKKHGQVRRAIAFKSHLFHSPPTPPASETVKASLLFQLDMHQHTQQG